MKKIVIPVKAGNQPVLGKDIYESESMVGSVCPSYVVIPAKAGIQKMLTRGTIRMDKQRTLYFLGSKLNGTLYIGTTSNFIKRIWQHRSEQLHGFI